MVLGKKARSRILTSDEKSSKRNERNFTIVSFSSAGPRTHAFAFVFFSFVFYHHLVLYLVSQRHQECAPSILENGSLQWSVWKKKNRRLFNVHFNKNKRLIKSYDFAGIKRNIYFLIKKYYWLGGGHFEILFICHLLFGNYYNLCVQHFNLDQN